jgi:hypothetical protein
MRYRTALDFRRALTHCHNEQARKTGTGVNDLHHRRSEHRLADVHKTRGQIPQRHTGTLKSSSDA